MSNQETTIQTEANPFDLDEKFHVYLVQMGIDRAALPADRYRELKRTFLHGCGKILHLLLWKVAAMPEKEGTDALYDMVDQVDRFTFKDIAEDYQSMSGDLMQLLTKDPTREP